MQVQEHIVRIVKVHHTTPQIRLLHVKRPLGLDYLPGQFFMVSVPHDPNVKVSRAYSVASSPTQENFIEFGFNKVGVFTTKLFSMKEGEELRFKGPYGKFFFDGTAPGEVVLIGAGTGITPLMSIVRYCTDKGLGNKLSLLYSVKVPEEIAYRNELDDHKRRNPHFHYTTTVTKSEESTGTEWDGRKGRIDKHLLQGHIHHPGSATAFICGSKEFVFSMIALLEEIGMKKEQIKTDVWG